jgi:hypothetical protein
MTTDPKELRLLLADVIEGLAATDRRVNALTLSVLALKGAVQTCDSAGRFDVQYERIYKIEAAQLKDQLSSGIALLLQIAVQLRRESS